MNALGGESSDWLQTSTYGDTASKSCSAYMCHMGRTPIRESLHVKFSACWICSMFAMRLLRHTMRKMGNRVKKFSGRHDEATCL